MTTMHLDNPRALNFGKRKRRPHDYWMPCLNEDTGAALKNRLVHEGSFTVVPYEGSNAHSAYLTAVNKRPKYKNHRCNVSSLGG
jgi:hypothetical protein